MITFCAIDKNNQYVEFEAEDWTFAHMIAMNKGYKEVGKLMKKQEIETNDNR